MAKNTLRSISVQTDRENDGRLDWLTVKFWRVDRSRYYSTDRMTDASFKRVGRFLFANGRPYFSRSFMAVDWYNGNPAAWNNEG